MFFEVFGRFRGYRKVREACRKNFHLVAPLKTSVARFYDKKTKKVHEYLINEYLISSVSVWFKNAKFFDDKRNYGY